MLKVLDGIVSTNKDPLSSRVWAVLYIYILSHLWIFTWILWETPELCEDLTQIFHTYRTDSQPSSRCKELYCRYECCDTAEQDAHRKIKQIALKLRGINLPPSQVGPKKLSTSPWKPAGSLLLRSSWQGPPSPRETRVMTRQSIIITVWLITVLKKHTKSNWLDSSARGTRRASCAIPWHG